MIIPIIPAAIGAGVGYVRAKKKSDRTRGAVKGALWGVGLAFVAIFGLAALSNSIGKDELGFFRPQ